MFVLAAVAWQLGSLHQNKVFILRVNVTREEYLEKLQDDPVFVKKCLAAVDSLQDKREAGRSGGIWMGWKGTDLRKATVLVTKMRFGSLSQFDIKEARKLLEMYYPQLEEYCKLS